MLGKKHENILDRVVEDMKREKKEITRESIRGYIMGRVLHGDDALGKLTSKPIFEYCEKHCIK